MPRLHRVMLAAAALALAGCARTPPGVVTGGHTLVTFEVQVAGQINPADFYYIVLDTNNSAVDGPVPVTSVPYGNGYATGSFTHFILYSGAGGFQVYQSSDANHTSKTFLGQPLQGGITTTNHPNDTLFVQLDTAQVSNVNPSVNALDVNIITTNIVPHDTESPVDKVVDGLGSNGRQYVTIPLTYTNTYSNGVNPDPGDTERAQDAPGLADNPDIDIVNWRMTVQTNG